MGLLYMNTTMVYQEILHHAILGAIRFHPSSVYSLFDGMANQSDSERCPVEIEKPVSLQCQTYCEEIVQELHLLSLE